MTIDAKFRRAMVWLASRGHEDRLEHCIQARLGQPGGSSIPAGGVWGRFFVEQALTFGGCNSPTLYNMVARLLIELAALESGMDTRHSVQQLDDNCSTASVGSRILWRYLKSYRGLADELGIRLAPEDDPAKAFPPSPAGEILGIEYDGPCRVVRD